MRPIIHAPEFEKIFRTAGRRTYRDSMAAEENPEKVLSTHGLDRNWCVLLPSPKFIMQTKK
jgi:hypothetical protein